MIYDAAVQMVTFFDSNATSAGVAPRQRARVRVRTLVFTRWLAVFGQISALLLVSEGMGAEVPMLPGMSVVACSAALNLWLGLRGRLKGWHSDREAAFYLAYDILQLAVMLYLTGGLKNPFALLFLVPVTVSATILSLGSTIGLGLFTFVCMSLLLPLHLPLPWPGGGLDLPPVYMLGTWFAITLGMTFLMFYAWRVAEEARRMSDALAETQLALAREQELSSLDGLAAAAAHELGTPLGTIALVSKELSRDLPTDSELADDVRLLNSQVERCSEILARLARGPRDGASQVLRHVTLPALISAEAEAHGREGIDIVLESNGAGPPPVVRRTPELLQGLGNLVVNAVDFARAEVRILVDWDETRVGVEIVDDGPGFAADILSAIGDPYVTTRPDSGGMGLGVFISKTLLERTGAGLRFANLRRGRGATVSIGWPRAAIEEQE